MDAYGFLDGMTDRELADLQTAILRRQALRRKLDISPEKVDAAVEEYHRATGKGQGEEWEEPRGRFDSYDRDAEVTVDGELWFSLIPNNPHKPGVAGWRLKPLIDPEAGKEIPPRYVRPSSAADAYNTGERITWTDGTIREAARDGVDWDPDTAPQDWELVEEEAEPDPPEEEEPDPEEPTDPEEPEPGDGDGDEDEDPEPDEPDAEPGTIDNPHTWSGDGVQYKAGDYVVDGGVLYLVRSGHKSQHDWTPHAVAALYKRQGQP